MKVDLERLRRVCRGRGAPISTLTTTELAALLAAVDAALAVTDPKVTGPGVTGLRAALEPFTPADRAWEEVDHWNAEQATGPCMGARDERCDPRPGMCACFDRPPVKSRRDRARDQLADAGVAVQRQFRSDQERIAELEARLARVPALVDALRYCARPGAADSATASAALAAYWEKP